MLRKGVSSNYKGLFDDWEIAIVTKLVNDFRKAWQCLQREEFEDLLQECLIHWLFAKEHYDSNKGASKKTYLGRVIRNKLGELVRDRETDKRKIAYIAISLDQPSGGDADSSTSKDTISERRPATAVPDPSMEMLTRIDISKVLERLTQDQRLLCSLLYEEGFTVTEASKYLKTPRSTIYDEIERIRKFFMKKGLGEFLE